MGKDIREVSMFKWSNFIFLVVVIALIAGCKSRPVEVSRYPLYAPEEATQADAALAIAKGGVKRGWEMDLVDNDRFYATRRFRRHVIMVDLQFNTKEIVIKYRDSLNMNYDGRSIHKAYHREVSYLAGSIQSAARFMAPSGTSKEGKELVSWGTGFVVSLDNEVLTNHHVVNDCKEILAGSEPAEVIASDAVNDLALLRLNETVTVSQASGAPYIAILRSGPLLRKGEDVIVAGYPLAGLLSSEMKVTTGSVNALAGPNDDRRTFQISAEVQPGNSGGPALDRSGRLIGVVSSRVSDRQVVDVTGMLPQNINFAIGLGMVRAFLEAERVAFVSELSEEALPSYQIAELAQGFTVQIQCKL